MVIWECRIYLYYSSMPLVVIRKVLCSRHCTTRENDAQVNRNRPNVPSTHGDSNLVGVIDINRRIILVEINVSTLTSAMRERVPVL